MKGKILLALLLVCSSTRAVEAVCTQVGQLAYKIANDRDLGVSLPEAREAIRKATSYESYWKMVESIYGNAARLSPRATEKVVIDGCMEKYKGTSLKPAAPLPQNGSAAMDVDNYSPRGKNFGKPKEPSEYDYQYCEKMGRLGMEVARARDNDYGEDFVIKKLRNGTITPLMSSIVSSIYGEWRHLDWPSINQEVFRKCIKNVE